MEQDLHGTQVCEAGDPRFWNRRLPEPDTRERAGSKGLQTARCRRAR